MALVVDASLVAHWLLPDEAAKLARIIHGIAR